MEHVRGHAGTARQDRGEQRVRVTADTCHMKTHTRRAEHSKQKATPSTFQVWGRPVGLPPAATLKEAATAQVKTWFKDFGPLEKLEVKVDPEISESGFTAPDGSVQGAATQGFNAYATYRTPSGDQKKLILPGFVRIDGPQRKDVQAFIIGPQQGPPVRVASEAAYLAAVKPKGSALQPVSHTVRDLFGNSVTIPVGTPLEPALRAAENFEMAARKGALPVVAGYNAMVGFWSAFVPGSTFRP